MTTRNLPARLRKQAREAGAQRKADAARRATPPMPGGLRALDYRVPLPNKKPIVTKKESTRVPGWAGVVASSTGDKIGGLATRSTEIRPPVVRSHTGRKASHGGADAYAEGMRSDIRAQWDLLHVTK